MTHSRIIPKHPRSWSGNAFAQIEALQALLNDEYDSGVTFRVRSRDPEYQGDDHRSMVNAVVEAEHHTVTLDVSVGDDLLGRVTIQPFETEVLHDWTESLDGAIGWGAYSCVDEQEWERKQLGW